MYSLLTETMQVVLDENAFKPDRAHDADAGLDLYSPVDVVIPPDGSAVIDTGVHVYLPPGTAGLLVSKSGLNVKHDITSTGLIDEGYTGPIVVKLYNHGKERYHISRGDKISQLVVIDVKRPAVSVTDTLPDSERGDNGFGSTGK